MTDKERILELERRNEILTHHNKVQSDTIRRMIEKEEHYERILESISACIGEAKEGI
jgi:hypothetical protein